MMDTREIFAQNLSRLLKERGVEQQTVAMDLLGCLGGASHVLT